MIQLPETLPTAAPATLWSLQLELLELAESVLGQRDTSKNIYQPQFVSGGPHIRHTPDHDGAFVELSLNAEGYWPTVLYEMAHETVHLLNPTLQACSNYLEEGVAVAFSIAIQASYKVPRVQFPATPSYGLALSHVELLPGHPLVSGKRIREQAGALSDATSDQLIDLFPDVDATILKKLVEKFVRETN